MSAVSSRERAHVVREHVLRMGAGPTGAHVGGSLSAVDILTVLYFDVLRVRPDEPEWEGRDWFILSKGHASAALYAVLAERGFFPAAELDTYGREGSRLAGHPLRRLPGVELGTGSLGHGLSLGLGWAIAARRDGRPNRTYVLMGDGELQEGSVWEAAMAASHLEVGGLTAIVDRNGWQITSTTEECVRLEPLAERWASFGWAVSEVDGHDMDALAGALRPPGAADGTGGRPRVVIARTVKGRGVGFFENRKKSHYVTLTQQLHQRALIALRASQRGGR